MGNYPQNFLVLHPELMNNFPTMEFNVNVSRMDNSWTYPGIKPGAILDRCE